MKDSFLIILFCYCVNNEFYWVLCMEWVHGVDDGDDIFAFILYINIYYASLLVTSSSSNKPKKQQQQQKPSYYCFIIKICSNTLCWCQITEIAISLLFLNNHAWVKCFPTLDAIFMENVF